jgi:hypothetical protein
MPYFGNNAPTSDNDRDDTLQRIRMICAEILQIRTKIGVFCLLAVVLAACEAAVEETDVAAPATAPGANCGPAGFLETELFGALAGKVDWNASQLSCEGMPRPDGDGARLRFAGTVAAEYELAFIIAIPSLRRDETGKELPSTVTIIEEGAGRFFSNADQASCWTDILELTLMPGSTSEVAVRGSLYCVAPLVEVNGNSDVTLGDFNFRGLLDWEAS